MESNVTEALLNFTNLTTTTAQVITEYTDTNKYYKERDLAVNIANGINGILILTFNGIMLLLYAMRPAVRKHISFMMMQVFIFCALQGIEVGTIFVIHRLYRYQLPIWYCVVADIFMQFIDDYVLVLLPLLAIERLLSLVYPFLSRRKSRYYSLGSTCVGMLIILCTSTLPMIPAIGIPESIKLSHDHQEVSARRAKFYHFFNCQGYLNKRNIATPIIMLILQILCVSTVIGVYLRMYRIAKTRLTKFSGLTDHKRKKLRKAAISVMLVACVFMVTTVPFGLIQVLRGMCDTRYINIKSTFCTRIGLNLRFSFGIIQHLGFLFAPMLFAVFNPKIRKALRHFLCCGRLRGEVPVSSRASMDPYIREGSKQSEDISKQSESSLMKLNDKSSSQGEHSPTNSIDVDPKDMPYSG